MMYSVKRSVSVIILSVLGLMLLASCGRVKTPKELYKYAKRTYGKCKVVSYNEDEKKTSVIVHDKLQDFDYEVSSSMHNLSIDGSSFGDYEHTNDTFKESLMNKIAVDAKSEIDALFVDDDIYLSNSPEFHSNLMLEVRCNDQIKAQTVALKYAEIIERYNLRNRLDGIEIRAYKADKSDNEEGRYGSIKLPDIKFRSLEDEDIDYYTEMAKTQTDSKAEFVKKEKKTFKDTGASLDRVVNVLGTDYPTALSSPVMFYYFRASTGEEYYICDFNYYDEDYYRYSWYTNYSGGEDKKN